VFEALFHSWFKSRNLKKSTKDTGKCVKVRINHSTEDALFNCSAHLPQVL
jgi:hypothetical protein